MSSHFTDPLVITSLQEKADAVCYWEHPGTKKCRKAREYSSDMTQSHLCYLNFDASCYDHFTNMNKKYNTDYTQSCDLNHYKGSKLEHVLCNDKGANDLLNDHIYGSVYKNTTIKEDTVNKDTVNEDQYCSFSAFNIFVLIVLIYILVFICRK
jgi:hypothetical protein